MKTHTRENSFSCGKCDYMRGHNNNFKTQQLAHHTHKAALEQSITKAESEKFEQTNGKIINESTAVGLGIDKIYEFQIKEEINDF